MKAEVSDFIGFFLTKVKTSTGGNKQVPKPKFGSDKGIFKIKPGFDDPIEDFNDYMY